jgi:hypothetical protein
MKIDLQKHWGSNEIYHQTELISKIIYSMQNDGSVHLYTKEGKNSYHNGLYKILDQLCEYWNWDKSKITIETANHLNIHPEYNVILNLYSHPHDHFDISNEIYQWNKEKIYGMFIGRPTAERAYAAHNHLNFEHKHLGLTSFVGDIFNQMENSELVQYFFHSNQTYKEMLKVTTYSDIKELVDTPMDGSTIAPPYNCNNWGKVYEKIAIEIVCETSTVNGCFDPSEKIMRPLYYKRPFIVIGSPNYLKNLQAAGYQTFNDFFNESYDHQEGFLRVEQVFDLLDSLISSNQIYTLLEDCLEVLEHNHKVFVEQCYQRKRLFNNGYD